MRCPCILQADNPNSASLSSKDMHSSPPLIFGAASGHASPGPYLFCTEGFSHQYWYMTNRRTVTMGDFCLSIDRQNYISTNKAVSCLSLGLNPDCARLR